MPERVQTADLSLYIPTTPILSATETARIMGFPSREALAKARLSGRLGIRMFQLQGRRGWFSYTQDVKAWLEASINGAPEAQTPEEPS